VRAALYQDRYGYFSRIAFFDVLMQFPSIWHFDTRNPLFTTLSAVDSLSKGQ
jgi:hypothetical protein